MKEGKKRKKAAVSALIIIAAAALVFLLTGRVYHISDGTHSVSVFCHSREETDILEKSGLEYGESDAVFETDDGYRILRSKNVTVTYGDETESFATFLETVGEVIDSSGMVCSGEDFCDFDEDEPVYDGMELTVHRVTHDETVTDTEIPWETVVRDSIYVKKGTTKVVRAGVSGIKREIKRNTYVDGQLIASNTVYDSVVSQPTAQIEERGTGGVIGGYEFSYCLDMKATAYTYSKTGTNRTATGVPVGYGKVAVDRSVIPLGTKLYIQTANGKIVYGYAVAADTGVRGNVIDLFYDTYEECINFGRRSVKVYILE